MNKLLILGAALLLQSCTTADEKIATASLDEADKQKLVAVTQSCLLYTSPSPRDKRQSRMPSSA